MLNYRAMDEEQAAAAISEEHAVERQASEDAVRQARKRIAARAAAHKAEVQAGDSRRPMDGEYRNYDEEKTSQVRLLPLVCRSFLSLSLLSFFLWYR